MTSAIPALFDALIDFARDNTTAVVSDGKLVSNDAGDYLMVGVDNPGNREQRALVAAQDWPYAGSQTRHEQGEIFCTAESVNGDAGDAGQKAARDGVYALVSALESAIKAAKDLGITTFSCEVAFGSVSALTQLQDGNGSRATLTFRLAFQAWTTS